MKTIILGALAIISCNCLAAQPLVNDDTIKEKILQKYQLTLSDDVKVEKTDYPHMWALRTTQPTKYPAYVDENLEFTINFPDAQGLVAHISDDNKSAILTSRRQQLANAIPLDKFIAIKNSTPFVAIVYSTPQCPYSQKMEAYLNKHGISYFVAPTSLNNEGVKWAEKIFCSKNKARAWLNAMTQQLDGDGGYCGKLPYQAAEDMAYMLMPDGNHRPGVPAVFFADGSSVSGWDQKSVEMLQSKIGGKIFFNK